MIHMPCSLSVDSVCKKNGKCKKKFPKKFAPATLEGEDSYPIYRRRDDGREVTLHNGKVVNNSWVVPYNPWLLKKYDCHINVDICSSVKSVKYLYKYVWKGVDCVCMEVSSEKGIEDEIKQYVDARWICPQEALWRIYKYQMNKICPPVVSLQIHLKDHQKILLPEGRTVRAVLQRERASRTKLTEYFKKNAEDEFARTLLYKEFPEHYVWNQSLRQWDRRRRNNRVIGRVNVVSTCTNNYYPRLLLNNVRGPTSYEDLLKVGSVTFSTYREVAQHLGLLESDTAMRDTLFEATQVQMPSSLRRLFCTMLALWNPTGVRELWDEFLPHLIEDHIRSNTEQGAINLLLRELSSTLGPDLMKKYKFPTITEDVGTSGTNDLVMEEKSIPIPPEDLSAIGQLNNDQRHAFDRVVTSVSRRENSIFFIDCPGGSGKTFLYRAILAYLRTEGHIAIATATSGIAATMMPGGRTAHSRFKIPVPADSTSSCDIHVDTDLADLIRKASLIIWDEATMANRYAFEALDRTLRDITKVELPFGGKIMVLGGDFRQVLPVIEHGTRAQALSACLTNAKFWKDVKVIHLKENMRSRLDPDFLEFLLLIGDGVEPCVMEDMVKLPDDIVLEWDGEQAVKRLID
ncbi:uncharacterized protein LOC113334784 isoform X2 [Papaver somniferum]|nr:uncharacterized protein LOC113334784 isoform X2 [Papaver somniferum]